MQFTWIEHSFPLLLADIVTSTEWEIGKAWASQFTPATTEWSVQISEIPVSNKPL